MLSPAECDALTDKQLIAHIRESDSELAWETLVRRHSSKAYHIAYGVLGNRDDAEEVAQDAFVRIYRALDRFRGDSDQPVYSRVDNPTVSVLLDKMCQLEGGEAAAAFPSGIAAKLTSR